MKSLNCNPDERRYWTSLKNHYGLASPGSVSSKHCLPAASLRSCVWDRGSVSFWVHCPPKALGKLSSSILAEYRNYRFFLAGVLLPLLRPPLIVAPITCRWHFKRITDRFLRAMLWRFKLMAAHYRLWEIWYDVRFGDAIVPLQKWRGNNPISKIFQIHMMVQWWFKSHGMVLKIMMTWW